ncbi:mitochondrial Homoaconitase [Arthrobotrys musiformis]|uniref:Mitochondrial Homoaconitase n=1 Tax=Arthrobotrys musiformis TaxID=47236 RepID=A0AAV9WMR6_9PEZI
MLQRSLFRAHSLHLPKRCSYLPPSNFFSTTTATPKPRPFYTTPFFTIPTAFLLGYATYAYTTATTQIYPINPYTFTKHTVKSTIPLSPSSALITLSPSRPTIPPEGFWKIIYREGVWSVQIKQPQLQIQREYTPLPTINSDENGNEITIFVRAVGGGEVSPYLLSRKEGDVVEVRGPVVTYPFLSSEGGGEEAGIRNVLFIAGGTGVSPAVQLSSYLLSQTDGVPRRVKILFASRTSSETPIPHLKELQKLGDGKKGVKVDIEFFHDDRDTFIRKPDIEAAVSSLELGGGDGKGGRDVIVVSGPEGFVEYYAGKKGWEGGFETQGVLAGLVGEVVRGRKKGGKIEVMKL